MEARSALRSGRLGHPAGDTLSWRPLRSTLTAGPAAPRRPKQPSWRQACWATGEYCSVALFELCYNLSHYYLITSHVHAVPQRRRTDESPNEKSATIVQASLADAAPSVGVLGRSWACVYSSCERWKVRPQSATHVYPAQLGLFLHLRPVCRSQCHVASSYPHPNPVSHSAYSFLAFFRP